MECFSITFDYLFEAVNDRFVAGFFQMLGSYGLRFSYGCRDGAGLTLPELTDRFQKMLSVRKPYVYQFYQMEFSFHGFSPIVGYWDLSGAVARFVLQIPEEDLIDISSPYLPEDTALKRTDQMDALLALAVYVWENSDASCIQTGWECSSLPYPYDDIRDKGYWPQAAPFAILPLSECHKTPAQITRNLSRCGILLEDNDAWNCSACWGSEVWDG